MQIIFILATFIILLSSPALLIYLALYILSKYFTTTLSLEYCGFLKFKNINFYYDCDSFFIYIHIDYFHIHLLWLKFRINIKGFKSTLTLKTQFSSLVRTKPINKYDFADSFIIRKQDTSNKNYGILHEIKEKFNKILYDKYIKPFIDETDKEKKVKFKIKNKSHEKIKLSFKDKLLRNLLSFFDLILSDFEFNFKLSESDFFYRISFNEASFRILKGLNINKEIHFLLIINNLNIKEYVNIKSIKFRKIISKKFNIIKAKRENKIQKEQNIFERDYPCLFGTYAEFILLKSQDTFLNIKLSNGFTPLGFNSFNNTIELKIEVNNTHIDLSSRAIETIMKTLNELSKYKHYQEYKYNNEIKNLKIAKDIINSREIKLKIDCNEEVLLNMIQNEIKKIKLKLENTSINILSDNHNYLYSNITLHHLALKNSNIFCSSCDETKIKLIKTKLDFSLDNIVISSSKKSKKILEIDKYDFFILKEVIYYYIIKESYIKTSINSDLPSLDISMNTKDLDKYVELMVNIICSLEKIEAYDKRSFFQTKYIEDMHKEINSNISFDNISMITYDDKIQGELNKCSFVLKMNMIENKSNKINLTFNPIYINAFRKYCSDYASNCIVKGFELAIDDDLKSKHINIDIDDVTILIYDDFMIDMIKFISDFLTYNLRYSAKRKYKLQIQKEEFKAFPNLTEIIELNVKSGTIYDYVAIKDLFTLKFENFNYVIDDYIKIPQICIYHQNNSAIIKRKMKWLEANKFYCKFFMETNQVSVEFGSIILDIYSFDLIHPIITIFIYYNFFPFWVIYHMNYKYRISEDYKLIYIVNFVKKEVTSVKFEEITVYVNQNLIATCSLLQTNPEKLGIMKNEKRKDSDNRAIIDKLKELKTQQIKIKVNGFMINQKLFFEREINKNFKPDIEEEEFSEKEEGDRIKLKKKYYKANELQDYFKNNGGDILDLETKVTKIYQKSSPYYNKLSRISNLSLYFDNIIIYAENTDIFCINNFKVILKETGISDNFDLNFLNSYSLSYKNHSIFYKEVKSRKVKNTHAEIYCNDMKLNFIDVKIIDKIILFALNLNKKIMEYPFRENALDELADESPIEIKNIVHLYLEKSEIKINNLDPVTGEFYNELYLKINYLALGNEKDKNNNKTELTVYYLTFGFDINKNNLINKSKTRDYPLLILPLFEINIDGNVYRFNICSNYMNKINELNDKQENNEEMNNEENIELINHYIGDNKLDNFILNTQSFTIFINYHYLKVFRKIFENLWNRSIFSRKYLLAKSKNKPNNFINQNEISLDENINSYTKKRKQKLHTLVEVKPKNLFNNKEEKKIEKEKDKNSKLLIKMISTIFDMKIIYLINYKDKYDSIFSYHPQIKKQGYFGYIIRLFSSIIKYNNIDDFENKVNHGKLEVQTSLLTFTSLSENNLHDENFFLYDKDILNLDYNYKDSKIFNSFMELPYTKTNKYKALNSILLNKTGKQQIFEFYDNNLPTNIEYYKELPFDFNETLIKLYDIQLKYNNMNQKELEETYIYLNNMKVTWNKINMDMVGILVYEEIIPISNAILSILSSDDNANKDKDNIATENEMSKNYSLYSINIGNQKQYIEESEYSMNFVIKNFQICIENEITKSRVLISTQEDIILKINKVCFNEIEKNFLMELIIKDFIFYIPPSIHKNSPNVINWIRISENNNLYLPQDQFCQIAKFPTVFFEVKEIIKNNKEYENNNALNQIEEIIYNDKDSIVTNSTIFIKIDKLKGEFRKEDFNCFMNIIKVFIFNRGDSYAKEKLGMDSKLMDLKKYKFNEIKLKIKENINNKSNRVQKKVKEIKFELEEISMTLLNDKEKDFLILLMKKLNGAQTIYDNLGSELVTNIDNLKILDLQNPRNEIILSQQNSISPKNQKIITENNENKPFYVNKIEMLRFRLKDNYISIGTDSKWYSIQYLEIAILPLYINITKNQCDFILKFFFNTDTNKNMSGEEYKKIIEEELIDEENKKEHKVINKNDDNVNKPEEPFYFNNVKVNDMKLNISFFYGDGSPFNFKKAKIKLREFEKRDKFYPLAILISRFISHLKYMAIANLGNILSSFFFTKEDKNETNESTDEKKLKEENKNRKLLFGKLYDK